MVAVSKIRELFCLLGGPMTIWCRLKKLLYFTKEHVPKILLLLLLPTVVMAEGGGGRLTGSADNEAALLAAREALTSAGFSVQQQDFSVAVPQVGTEAEFAVGEDLKLELYKDYSVVTSAPGGGIDYRGPLVLAGTDWLSLPDSEIAGRLVVVEAWFIQPEWLEILRDKGARGVLFCTNPNPYGAPIDDVFKKGVAVGKRQGTSLFVGYISGGAYQKLKTLSVNRVVEDLRVKVAIAYPTQKTRSLIATLEPKASLKTNAREKSVSDKASTRTILISAAFDGRGAGPSGEAFESGAEHYAGVRAALGVAEGLKALMAREGWSSLPGNTRIVIALWNGHHQDQAGLRHYIDNPIYPLESTRVIHLERLGIGVQGPLQLLGDPRASSLWLDQVLGAAPPEALDYTRLQSTIGPGQALKRFTDAHVASCAITSAGTDTFPFGAAKDRIDALDNAQIERATDLVLHMLDGWLLPKPYLGLLKPVEWLLLAGLAIFSGVAALMVAKVNANGHIRWRQGAKWAKWAKWANWTAWVTWATRARRLGHGLVYGLILLCFLAFVANLNQATDLKVTPFGIDTNFSLYKTLSSTLETLRSLEGMGWSSEGALMLSAKLILGSLVIAYIGGYLLGLIESTLTSRTRLGAMGSLMALSLPDVLVVLLTLWGYTLLAMRMPQIAEWTALKGYWLPVAALSLLPTLYLARIAAIATSAELNKDYVRGGFALGYSRWQLLLKQVRPAVWVKLLDAMPTVLAMTFSNMIVVEYLFNYNGIGYFLLFLYRRQDVQRFVPLAAALAIGYLALVLIAGAISRRINPRKGAGAHDK